MFKLCVDNLMFMEGYIYFNDSLKFLFITCLLYMRVLLVLGFRFAVYNAADVNIVCLFICFTFGL
jgi:hypothetical protein